MDRNNKKYKMYQLYKGIKTFLMKTPIIGTLLAKVLNFFKDVGVRSYVFYVTKIRFGLTRRFAETEEIEKAKKLQVAPRDIVYFSQLKHSSRIDTSPFIGGRWDKLLKSVVEDSDGIPGSQKIEIQKSQIGGISSEISIDIGRYGDLLLVDGIQNLALARADDRETMTAMVLTRHIKWMRFRKRYETLVTRVGSRSYQPAVHPDLQYIPAEQSCSERFELIKANISASKGKLLDLGANIGYFAINFENLGFDCTAVEYFPNYIYGLVNQKRALNKQFKIIKKSFLDTPEVLDQSYDVVLALNVLSHLIVKKDTFEKLEHFLEKLKCKEMFFEPYSPDDLQMKDSYIQFTIDEFAEHVQRKLKLEHLEKIGTASDKRTIYKMY